MSVNGIWRIEMLGPYGWESVATAFLEDGKYRSASENHYTVGDYEVSGDQIRITAVLAQHGKARTVFGKKEKQMNLSFDGQVDVDRITGQARDDEGTYQVSYRAIRLAQLN